MSNTYDSNGHVILPGDTFTYTGVQVSLVNTKPETLNIADIAWGLGRQLRFNGHMKEDHTIAHHCIVMSYMVPEEFRMEALLHDAAEAYMGDIVHPVKQMFPEIDAEERRITGMIMERFGDGQCPVDEKTGIYTMSPEVHKADQDMCLHEAYLFGLPFGEFRQPAQNAWVMAAELNMDMWGAPYYAYADRWAELAGKDLPDIHGMLDELWFPPVPPMDEEEIGDEEIEEAVATLKKDLE